METKLRRRQTEITCIDEESDMRRAFGAQELMRIAPKPIEGRSIHILTGGNVDMICHVRWLLNYYKRFVKMFVSCWVIAAPDIMLLKRWHDNNEIGTIDILVGNVFPARYKMEWKKLTELTDEGMVDNLYISNIHCKIMMLEAESGEKIVIESSANCNTNPHVEQSCVTLSDKLYNFYREYFDKLFSMEDARYQRMLLRTGVKDAFK